MMKHIKKKLKSLTITLLHSDIYAIVEKGITEEVTSYLILGEENNILFDTGLSSKKGQLYKTVMKFVSHEPTVINSHGHYDHTGGNQCFSDVYAFNPKACGKTKENKLPVKLENNQRFDLGNRVLRVLHTPGHTEDCICLFDETNGILFSGDVIYEGTLYSMFKSDFFGNSNLRDYEQSMKQLEKLVDCITVIHPAHNEISIKPQMIIRAREALQKINNGKASPTKKRFLLKRVKQYAFKNLKVLTD